MCAKHNNVVMYYGFQYSYRYCKLIGIYFYISKRKSFFQICS